METEVTVQGQPGKGWRCQLPCPRSAGTWQPAGKGEQNTQTLSFQGSCTDVLVCLSMQVTAGPSQLLGRRIWEGQLSPSGICVSESRCCAAQDDCPRECSVPQIFHLRSKASPLDLCFSFSSDGIGTFMCPGAPTRAILQRNRYPLLPSLYSY